VRIGAGQHRGRKLVAPAGRDLRPTAGRTREALFDILAHGEPPLAGAHLLDLFAGTGAVGLEAWSRGAAEVVLVEHDPHALGLIRTNLERLGHPPGVRLLARDATRLGPAEQVFELAFLDPPYRSGLAEPALAGLLDGGWIAPAARVVVELAAREPFVPPARLISDDERRYGAARLVFLRPEPG
jgi:16S rRNA (guanine966-N2)-methyltransferase